MTFNELAQPPQLDMIFLNRLGKLPNGQALTACSADLFKAGKPLGRWPVSNVADAEKALEEFLSGLPSYKRKVFELDFESLTQDEVTLTVAEPLREAGQVDEFEARYMQLLEQIPERAKWYKRRQKEIFGEFSPGMPMPKIKRGRRPNVELAELIWSLHDSGKTSPEIQKILAAKSWNLTIQAIEAYLKTRRRNAKH